MRWHLSSRGVWVSDCARFAILQKPETQQWHLYDRRDEIGSFLSLSAAKAAAWSVIDGAWQRAEMVGGR